MTSSLLLEKRLSSFLLLHRHVTAVILWHFKLDTLEAQIQLAQGTCHSLLVVFQLGEGFFPQKCRLKPLDVFVGSEKLIESGIGLK